MTTTKPHKEYSELIDILTSRGMDINDPQYAERKLSQVGYYRLSGFWFTSRKIILSNETNQTEFIDEFLPHSSFNDFYKLYLFDKKLRLLILDIIERLEVNIRSVIAHELGKINPIAYIKEEFIKIDTPKIKEQYCKTWLPKLNSNIKNNKSEFINWHKPQGKDIPFWVVIEIWDFGTLSKYYSFLIGKYQNKIAKKFNIDANTFGKWLHDINLLRNACAHHSRIWNKDFNKILLPPHKINLSDNTQNRILSRILILWFLVEQTGSKNYKWLEKLKDLIDNEFPKNVPNISLKSMGLGEYNTLPTDLIKSC